MRRRDELAEQATDYALEHGLIGLSLRPLAAAIGTSDRMLVYHFGTKDALIAEIIVRSNTRSVRLIESLPRARTVRAAVLRLWQALIEPQLDRCQRVYIQAAALGILGTDPYRKAIARSDDEWITAVRDYLVGSGADPRRAARVAGLVDAGLIGLHLSLPVADHIRQLDAAVRDLADTAQRVSDGSALR
jgi:AcrR family transcriptional regulator